MSDFIVDNTGLCLCAVGIVIAFVRIIIYRKKLAQYFKGTPKQGITLIVVGAVAAMITVSAVLGIIIVITH